MNTEIATNLAHIQQRIQAACKSAGRPAHEVKLLLATKTVSAQRIAEALRLGHTLIAENKVQELKDKFPELTQLVHTNHFIGHLQTNKIKELIRYQVSCLQSLDREDLASKLNVRLELENQYMDVFIQVNTSGEESKFGVSPEGTVALCKYVAALPRLKIKGLMTIGLLSAQSEKVRECFRLLKSIQKQVNAEMIPGVDLQELSMGMSGDLEIAIEEGATIVRVGTAVFGTRVTPDSYYWDESR